jgi:hypothetical protein
MFGFGLEATFFCLKGEAIFLFPMKFQGNGVESNLNIRNEKW